jgi:hypothetical protein
VSGLPRDGLVGLELWSGGTGGAGDGPGCGFGVAEVVRLFAKDPSTSLA